MTERDSDIVDSTEASSPNGGTYSLLIELAEPIEIGVGALGELSFDPGSYAYTGSALGSGGFSRIERHHEIASGERDVRHWHVDYLLGHPATTIEAVWISPGADRECEIATELPGDLVPDFGASDCDCEAHLVAAPDQGTRRGDRLPDALARRHETRHD